MFKNHRDLIYGLSALAVLVAVAYLFIEKVNERNPPPTYRTNAISKKYAIDIKGRDESLNGFYDSRTTEGAAYNLLGIPKPEGEKAPAKQHMFERLMCTYIPYQISAVGPGYNNLLRAEVVIPEYGPAILTFQEVTDVKSKDIAECQMDAELEWHVMEFASRLR